MIKVRFQHMLSVTLTSVALEREERSHPIKTRKRSALQQLFTTLYHSTPTVIYTLPILIREREEKRGQFSTAHVVSVHFSPNLNKMKVQENKEHLITSKLSTAKYIIGLCVYMPALAGASGHTATE